MQKSRATRRRLPLLLGALILTGVTACHSGAPTAANQAPGASNGSSGSNGAAASGDASGVPQAPAGIGTNPVTLGQGAPPPSNTQGYTVPFNDPNNLPFAQPASPTSLASGLFFAGTWQLNGGYYEQSTGAKQASLTFREYNGNGFGTQDGSAPAHYRVDVTAWVYQPSDQYPNMVGAPLGIIGYSPYFKDETHYLLVVAKPSSLECWDVQGSVPGTTWPATSLLWSQALATPLAVGTPVAWSVEVDTGAQAATIWANGKQMTKVTSPDLTNSGQHVALISNGNYMHFQNMVLYSM